VKKVKGKCVGGGSGGRAAVAGQKAKVGLLKDDVDKKLQTIVTNLKSANKELADATAAYEAARKSGDELKRAEATRVAKSKADAYEKVATDMLTLARELDKQTKELKMQVLKLRGMLNANLLVAKASDMNLLLSGLEKGKKLDKKEEAELLQVQEKLKTLLAGAPAKAPAAKGPAPAKAPAKPAAKGPAPAAKAPAKPAAKPAATKDSYLGAPEINDVVVGESDLDSDYE
jgi:exonuclease VII small subunit